MPSRKCPVCHTGLIVRKDIKTCSVTCSREWNTWSLDMKAKAMSGGYDLDDSPEAVALDQVELEKWIGKNKQST